MTARGGHLLPPHINGQKKKPYNEKLEGIEAKRKPKSDRKDTKIIKQD